MPDLSEFTSTEGILRRISNPELSRFFMNVTDFLEDQAETTFSGIFQGVSHVTTASLM